MSKRVANSRNNRHHGRYARQVPVWSERYRRQMLQEGRAALRPSVGLSSEFRQAVKNMFPGDAPAGPKVRRRGLQTSRRGE